jgi:glyoxylase-like metal-dependent hydrolase (beta-lactamase superfamily II)
MSEYPDPDVEVDALSPAELAASLDAGEPTRLLDVRNRDEFESWHVEGATVTATQIPYMKWLQADAQDTVADRAADIEGEGPITVVCGRGEASAYVASLLQEAGIEARNLAEGMDGWARVYQANELSADVPPEGVTVVQYRRPSSGCLGYTIVADGEAMVVDPLREFTDRYVADAHERDATIEYAVDTHVHADHVSGLRELAAETGATPVMPRLSVERGVTYDVETVIHNEELSLGSTTVRAVHLPGHTTGMTGFEIGDVLLSGDSLFVESVARPDLERGAKGAESLAYRLHESLTERIGAFDDDTLVAPGHYSDAATPAHDGSYTARLGDLRERLSVFSADRSTFVANIIRDMPPQPANYERIIAANMGVEDLDDADAFELELGPNNCAASPSRTS